MSRPAYEQKRLEGYIKYKIKILKQMHIYLTPDQTVHIYSLTRRIDIDNYCHDIMMNSNA